MIASLPMYDLPELRTMTDAWWTGLARALRRAGVEEVPNRLTRSDDLPALWHRPDLLVSQACGYPLMHQLSGVLQPIVTPLYDVPGCVGPYYCSVIVVGADRQVDHLGELRGAVCAVNSYDSQSGYNCLRAMLAPLAEGGRFFSRVVESGAHAKSLTLVASGAADVCAIDCVTYALFARYRPQALAGTRVLDYTPAVPAIPYVTRATADPDLVYRLRDGLMAALTDPALVTTREALLLAGAQALPAQAYEAIVDMEAMARAAGYPELV